MEVPSPWKLRLKVNKFQKNKTKFSDFEASIFNPFRMEE